MSRQVEAAEKRAMIGCPVYDEMNMHWKVADNLAKELSVLVNSISEKTAEKTVKINFLSCVSN